MIAVLAALALAAAPDPGVGAPLATCQSARRQLEALDVPTGSKPAADARSRALLLLAQMQGELDGTEVGGVTLHPRWIARAADSIRNAQEDELGAAIHFALLRFVSLCAALRGSTATAPQVDRAKLVAILSRPEYELRARDESLLMRLLERLRTWFRDAFATARGVQEAASWIRATFLIAVCLLAAALAWRLARVRLRRGGASSAHPPGPATASLEDPARYAERAAAALDGGDGREAIRWGLLRLLSTLERTRLAAPGRTSTNHEVAEQIAERGGPLELAGRARTLLGWYDAVWYGLAPVEAIEARRFLEQIDGCCSGAEATGGRR